MYYKGSGTKLESYSTENMKLAEVSCTARLKKFPCVEEQQGEKVVISIFGNENQARKRK